MSKQTIKPHWLFGVIKHIKADALGFMSTAQKELGNFAQYKIGPYKAMQVSDPAAVYEILVKQADKFPKGTLFWRDL